MLTMLESSVDMNVPMATVPSAHHLWLGPPIEARPGAPTPSIASLQC